jgi:hypothetical protein
MFEANNRFSPILIFSLLINGCAASGDSTTGSVATIEGRLTIAELDGRAAAGARVFSMGNPSKIVTADADGKFQLEVNEDELDQQFASFDAVKVVALYEGEGHKYGLQTSDLNLESGNKNIGDQSLTKTGNILVTAKKYGRQDHSGIDVYIPGTDFTGKTDSNGIVSLTAIPEGQWSLRADSDGYISGKLSGVSVSSDDTSGAGPLNLVIDLGVVGALSVKSQSVNSYTVDLGISWSGEAVMYKISEDPVFINTVWQPIEDTTSYTFSSVGAKTLYVKFANENGLESDPFSLTLSIEYPTPLRLRLTDRQGNPLLGQRLRIGPCGSVDGNTAAISADSSGVFTVSNVKYNKDVCIMGDTTFDTGDTEAFVWSTSSLDGGLNGSPTSFEQDFSINGTRDIMVPSVKFAEALDSSTCGGAGSWQVGVNFFTTGFRYFAQPIEITSDMSFCGIALGLGTSWSGSPLPSSISLYSDNSGTPGSNLISKATSATSFASISTGWTASLFVDICSNGGSEPLALTAGSKLWVVSAFSSSPTAFGGWTCPGGSGPYQSLQSPDGNSWSPANRADGVNVRFQLLLTL